VIQAPQGIDCKLLFGGYRSRWVANDIIERVDSAELTSLDDDASELDLEIVMPKMMVNDLEKVHLDQW
nr:hypothetical protein [Tanacetum cinerariifolium]